MDTLLWNMFRTRFPFVFGELTAKKVKVTFISFLKGYCKPFLWLENVKDLFLKEGIINMLSSVWSSEKECYLSTRLLFSLWR